MPDSKNQGFTLIEISIVLVIIGLLTGAVLKGQQMIENARYKSFVQEVDAYRTAVYAFQDRYRYLPGDYPNTAGHLKADGSALPGGDGDGIVETDACSQSTEESCLILRHLMAAGLIAGDPGISAPADLRKETSIGGIFRGMAVYHWGGKKQSLQLLLAGIPGEFIQRYDEEFDDGKANSGIVTKYVVATSLADIAENYDAGSVHKVHITM